tara:strand:- start:149 stop:1366 length:1218 start_codon:yes stop_codon:yes gene_type:complete
MAKLPGAYETLATVGAPAINFVRGILGYQDPFLTQTMQDRMKEIEGGRTRGNVGYEDYGLDSSAGRFTGGLMNLAINNPVDFGLAGSIGKYDFGPEGRKGLTYDFTPDKDTGSTGNAILDFINRGGLKGAFSRMGTAEASDLGAIASNEMLQSILNPKTPTLGENLYDPPGRRILASRIRPEVDTEPLSYAGLSPINLMPDPDYPEYAEVDMGATGTIPTLNNTGIMNIDVPFGTPIDIAQGFTKNTPSDQGTNFQFLPSANEANETDVVEEKKRGGIADLFKALLGFAIPGASFFFNKGRDALGGIRSLNQRLRNTDFAKSKTLADYLDARKYGGRDERDAAAARNMAQARGIQKKIDRGDYGTRDTSIDRGRGSIPSRSSPTTSRRNTSPSSSYSQASYSRRR